MKKYLCMKESCTFCTDDLDDALEHQHQGQRHRMIEVDANGEIGCHDLGQVSELEFDEEEL
jgi:hypothetical protein